MSFFFSSRIFASRNGNMSIVTDCDFNFDCLTTLTSFDKELVSKHRLEINSISATLKDVGQFLGTVISIVFKLIKGPFGWIQLGMEVIK